MCVNYFNMFDRCRLLMAFHSGEMVTGQRPAITILTKPVNAVRKPEPDSLHFKCSGRMPSGPRIVPAGNDSTAFLTSFSFTDCGVLWTPAKLGSSWENAVVTLGPMNDSAYEFFTILGGKMTNVSGTLKWPCTHRGFFCGTVTEGKIFGFSSAT